MTSAPSSREFVEWESGAMTGVTEVDFFQRLVDSQLLDTLSAKYQARAQELVNQGEIFL